MRVANFVAKYSSAGIQGSKMVVPYDKIKATEKWVEYSIDIQDMTRALPQATFDEKWKLAAALEIAERKRTYMYRHKNFDLGRASRLFDAVRDLPTTK